MAEALDTLERVAAPAIDDGAKFPLNDLPNDLLVSVFEAVGDLRWVRHTVPLVCKAWNELYCSQNASPLHETLEVDFEKEVASAAAREGEARGGFDVYGHPATAEAREWARRHPVHASSVISWAERRAGWVRELHVKGRFPGAFKQFNAKGLGRLVAVVGPSLTGLYVNYGVHNQSSKPFWDPLRVSVVPHGRLRSLVVEGPFADASESDLEPLGQLAGSLEELALRTYSFDGVSGSAETGSRLERLPESLCALTELRRLALTCHQRITALPAQISSLKKLKELTLRRCGLSSLPEELSELSGLTKLDLWANTNLGYAPQDEVFPAALGRMKSLRELNLAGCFLGAVPAFVGELESLETLELSFNVEQIFTTLDILIEGCPRLREVRLWEGGRFWTRESLAHLEAFKAKLRAKNPNAEVQNW